MADYPLALFSPRDVYDRAEGSIRNWNDFPVRFLAQGDSWFSISAMPPWSTSNILQKIVLGFPASAVNCAYPGRELAQMSEWQGNAGFARLLSGPNAVQWHGILLSGGGNDLISATAVFPYYADHSPIPANLRLLLNPAEWRHAATGPTRYLSDAGWMTFCRYLAQQFRKVLDRRDENPLNRDIPLFCHTYDYPMPRNAPASAQFHMGPWLYPAFIAYRIPPSDWLGVAKALIDHLKDLLRTIIRDLEAEGYRHVHLIDTTDTITPAEAGSIGASHDWNNEIHPTSRGYRKLAAHWRKAIAPRFASMTGPAPSRPPPRGGGD